MANEKRLVNAETIARKLKNAHCAECKVVRKIQCSACWVNDVLELLDGDSVDAVEVVHGRWIRRCVDHELPYYFVHDCSVCGCSGEDYYYYCPHCGAKMDGGNEDG